MDPKTTRLAHNFVGQTRCDVAPTVAAVRTTVVDPGFCKPVHVASVRTDSNVPFDDAEHWHLTEEEWITQRLNARPYSVSRRDISDAYARKRPESFIRDAGRVSRRPWSSKT